MSGGRPVWLTPIPEQIPPELRALPAVVWRAATRGGGKPTKVPYQSANPRRKASSTDPNTWNSFGEAREAFLNHDHLDGIGVVLTHEARITCIDLDRVIDKAGVLDIRAQTIVDRCESYTELSPSGTGLHVFVFGRVPRGLRGDQIEIYSTARYIAITGCRWPSTPPGLRDQQPYLDHLTRVEALSSGPRPIYTGPPTKPPDDLAGALLAKLQTWGVPVVGLKPWSDGYLVELVECPWAAEHTTGPGGAAVAIHASGAYDFMCLHAHCGQRDWRNFRAAIEGRRI